MPGPKPDPPHGTRERYQLRRRPCRCDECRAANARAIARYRSLTPPPERPECPGQLPLPAELQLRPYRDTPT
jgi:hypothetical protein